MSAEPEPTQPQTHELCDELRRRARQVPFIAGVDIQSEHVNPWRSIFWVTSTRDGERFRITVESIS